MPITILGPPWPSTAALRAVCATLPQPTTPITIAYGVCAPGALNGAPRLNSLQQLSAFRAAGLCVPAFTTELNEARRWVAEGSLVFGRRLLHTQGRDIIGPRHPRWPRSQWWSRVVLHIQSEWRIHVFRGKVIARGLKVCTGPQVRQMPVRNRANGWTLNHTIAPPEVVREVARRALASLGDGYDFGAVDLLTTSPNDTLTVAGCVVLEVNRAPALRSPYTLSAYVGAIAQYINELQ